MNNLIETLKIKYNKLSSRQKEYELSVKEINENINKLLNAFDNFEMLDEEDKKDICDMLDKEHVLMFKNNEKFFKAIKKFPNQPQVIKAKEVLAEIKECLRKNIINDNREVFNIVSENGKKIKVIKYYIDLFSKYTKDTYITSYDLYSAATLLHNSEIDDEIIDFYNTILINNNSLTPVEENEELSLDEYNDFVKRIKQINKSMSIDEANDDKKLYNLFNTILSKNYNISYDTTSVNEFINALNQQITADDEDDKDIVKRIKFFIHLHNVQVDLTDEQKDFVSKLKDFYKERVESHSIDEYSVKSCELITYLEDDYKFENVSLLVSIFKNMEIKPIDQLKLISLINKNNCSKQFNEKKDLNGGAIELLKSYNIETKYLVEEDISLLNSNLKNVSEVITHITKIKATYLEELSNDYTQVNILVELLVYSSKEIINKIFKICNKEEIDFVGLIDYSPYVLISKNIKKDCYGEYDNFMNNIEFCEQNNISVKSMENLLLEDNKVLRQRYNILTKLYGIDITGCETVLNNPIISILMDITIESSKLGYKFISANFDIFLKYCEELPLFLVYDSLNDLYNTHENNLLRYDPSGEKVILDEMLFRYIKDEAINHLGDDVYSRTKGSRWDERYSKLLDLFSEKLDSNGRYYYIIPEKYDYIDESLFEDKFIAHLENPKNKLKKNDYIYNLDGTYISRIKFLRICTFLKDKLQELNEPFDLTVIKFALRFEKIFINGSVEQKIEKFYQLKNENRTKKKKK